METRLNKLTLSFIITILMIINVSNVNGQDWQHLGGPPVADSVRDVSAGYKNGTFTIYAADKIVLSKSINQGDTWSVPDTLMKSPLLVACMPINSDTLLVAKPVNEGKAIFLSKDGGGSFIEVINNVDPLRILYSRGASCDAWVGTKYQSGKSSLYKSLDTIGFTEDQFFKGTNGNPKTDVTDVWTVPSNPNVVWVAGSKPSGVTPTQGGTSGLWRSTDRGVSWSSNLTVSFNPSTGAILNKYCIVPR